MLDWNDTIAALGSAPGPACRSIVRLSGSDTARIVLKCCELPRSIGGIPQDAAACLPARLQLGVPFGSVRVDLYLWPDERSYTRQPMAEIHMPGAPPLVQTALQTVLNCGARLAAPGEFTLRAFLAGRVDLAQAEAVLGIIDAANDADLQSALGQLAGGVSEPLRSIRERLVNLLAHLEATLDFVDEEIPGLGRDPLRAELDAISTAISALLSQCSRREVHRAELSVVLRGLPNSGKSSLLNAIVNRDVSLVSPTAGTTRDYVEARIELQGMPLRFIDTAGRVDEPFEWADRAAQIAAVAVASEAHIELLCVDVSNQLVTNNRSIEDAIASVAERSRSMATSERRSPNIIVVTKCDLLERPHAVQPDVVFTSSLARTGLDDLRARILSLANAVHASESLGMVQQTAARCFDSLKRASASLDRAASLTGDGGGDELVAEEIRIAANEVGEVLGAVYTDDLLDRIFGRFCIGK